MRSTIDHDYPAAHSMDTGWFGLDADGVLAFFDTGEDGLLVLEPFEQGPDAPGVLEEGAYFEQLQAIIEALGHDPEDDPSDPAVLQKIGLTAYSADYGLTPYYPANAPAQPVKLTDLPQSVRDQLGYVPLPHERFADARPVQPADHAVEVTTWSSADHGYLSADETMRRAVPGHEDGFRRVYDTEALELPVAEAEARLAAYHRRVAADSKRAAQRGYSFVGLALLVALLVWWFLA
jgi:hypothetical protein